jgi:hypothetical protein
MPFSSSKNQLSSSPSLNKKAAMSTAPSVPTVYSAVAMPRSHEWHMDVLS